VPDQVALAAPRRHRPTEGVPLALALGFRLGCPRLGRRGSVVHVLMSARTTGQRSKARCTELPYRTPGRQPTTPPPPPRLGDPALGTCPLSPAAHLARARGVHGGEAKPATASVKKTDCPQNYWRSRPLVPTFCRPNCQVRVLRPVPKKKLFLPALATLR
jgi:hypothetical protein